MIGFKGRVGFCQYFPMKPTKWGLKAFVLTDSATGYVLDIIPYTKGETRAYLSNCRTDLPFPAKIVMAISEKYLDKGHHIFSDRFYASVPLVEELEARQTGYKVGFGMAGQRETNCNDLHGLLCWLENI